MPLKAVQTTSYAGSRKAQAAFYWVFSAESSPMPKGPQGQKRPADVIGAAVMVAKIATAEMEDTRDDPAKEHHRRGGEKGGPARAAKLTAEQRAEVASHAAQARWKKG